MTPSELFALVGRAWVRLFLYPGGLSMLGAAWFVLAATTVFSNRHERRDLKQHSFSARSALFRFSAPWSSAAPWLAVALLPLPGAVNLGRGVDAVVVLALLDTPLLAMLYAELRADEAARRRGAARLAALLNGYPPLLLALLLLGGGGSFELGRLMQVPADPLDAALHWLGAVALVLALPPLVGFGPFAPRGRVLPLGMHLRAVGYWLLATLPWLSPLEGQLWQVLPPLVIAALLGMFHMLARGHPRAWARGYFVLDSTLLCALGVNAAQQLWERIQ